MKTIRIAFVASTFGIGGAERVMSDLIMGLDRDRFESRLFWLREAGVMGRPLLEAGFRGIEYLGPGRFAPAVIPRLTRAFVQYRPDIVFSLDHHNAMFFARVAGLFCGARAQVIGSHSTGLYGKNRSFTRIDRALMGFTDRVVAVSKSHKEYLCEHEGISAGKVIVIENGIDVNKYRRAGHEEIERVRRELRLEPGQRVVMMVAALRPEKAHEALLGAAARLKNSGEPIRFLIVGDGERRAELEDTTRTMGLEDAVSFLGARDDVDRLLQVADVLVLPSHPVVETLPLSVLEAMASGVPVVASRVGSLPDVIVEGENGLLIKPADEVELAEGIAYILSNEVKRGNMVAAARRTVEERYAMERMTGKYAELFESLVQQDKT